MHVHALTQEGLVPLVTERMPTARGFASQNHPTVLSKGGVMVQLNDRLGASSVAVAMDRYRLGRRL